MAAAWGGQSIALINEGGIRTGLEKVLVEYFHSKHKQRVLSLSSMKLN